MASRAHASELGASSLVEIHHQQPSLKHYNLQISCFRGLSPPSGESQAWLCLKGPGVFGLGLMRCLFQFGFEKLDEKNTGDKPIVVPDEDILQ